MEEEEKKEEAVETKKEEVKETKEGKKSNKALVILIIAAVAIVALALLGRVFYRRLSGKFAGIFLGKLISRSTGGNVNVADGGKKVTYSGKEGDFSYQAGGQLPEKFPSDFPVYPGAKLASSWTAKAEDGNGVSVVWETTDAINKVADFYKSELKAKGWTISTQFEQQDSFTYSFEKGSVNGFVGIAKGSDNKVTISVTLGVK